ncbi:MAG TPA: thiamine phosphate synthase [Burkholderiales bacterium]|nr:thiamine phosphate synthase [Burkholderiales bacterium]
MTPSASTISRISGLYAVTPDLRDSALLLGKVRATLEGGARLVQYRNKQADPELGIAQARALKALCAEYSARLIINDHLALALDVGADGVHLGGEDGALDTARARLPRGRLLGASCYDRLDTARAAKAAGADYVAFGSFFPSAVKPNAVRASVELLRSAKRELALPLVAIGGITLDNAPQLIEAGADALAVISALFDAPDIRRAAERFCALFA